MIKSYKNIKNSSKLKMKKLSIIVSIAIMASFTSCKKVTGDGPLVTENRTIEILTCGIRYIC